MFSPLNSGISNFFISQKYDKILGKNAVTMSSKWANVNSMPSIFWSQDKLNFGEQRLFLSFLFLPAKFLSLAPSPKSCLLTPLNIPKCLEPPFCVEFPTWRSRSAITQYSERSDATIITNAIKANTAVTIPVPRRLKRLAILLHGIIRTCFGESFAK